MNNRSENTNTASFDEHGRAEGWDSNDRLETESSAANVYAQGGLSRLQTYAANQVSGKKVTASWRAALAVRDAGPPAMLRSVRTNIVQSIRAFRTPDLQEAATELGQHFIYANCANAMTKGEVLEAIAIAYSFTKQQAKNFDPLLATCKYKGSPPGETFKNCKSDPPGLEVRHSTITPLPECLR